MSRRTEPRPVGVSVIVPAYNEGARLPQTLPALLAGLTRLDTRAEVIVVDDGSTDGTAAVAALYLRSLRNVRVLQLPWNCGKGAAIRAGVSLAGGAVVVVVDADLAINPDDLARLLSLPDTADIVLGSRLVPAPGASGRTVARHLASAVFRGFVRNLTSAPLAGSRCGIKAFKAPVAKLLFSMTTSTGFGFDVEVLSLARALGHCVVDCPVHTTASDARHISLRHHGTGILHDLHRAHRHQQRAGTALREQAVYPAEPRLTPRAAGGRHLSVSHTGYVDPPTEQA